MTEEDRLEAYPTSRSDHLPANPFCTRHVRPGALPFHFPPDQTAPGLVRQLRIHGWRGAILGPHGSGKSTLLAMLIPAIEHVGRRVAAVVLHNGQRRLPRDLCLADYRSGTVIVVDGYEQLGLLARCRLRWHCRRNRLGLLVTAHCPVGLPELYRTQPTLQVAQSIVAHLQGSGPELVTADDVAQVYPRHGGNFRELLFELYDLFESRQRKN